MLKLNDYQYQEFDTICAAKCKDSIKQWTVLLMGVVKAMTTPGHAFIKNVVQYSTYTFTYFAACVRCKHKVDNIHCTELVPGIKQILASILAIF